MASIMPAKLFIGKMTPLVRNVHRKTLWRCKHEEFWEICSSTRSATHSNKSISDTPSCYRLVLPKHLLSKRLARNSLNPRKNQHVAPAAAPLVGSQWVSIFLQELDSNTSLRFCSLLPVPEVGWELISRTEQKQRSFCHKKGCKAIKIRCILILCSGLQYLRANVF